MNKTNFMFTNISLKTYIAAAIIAVGIFVALPQIQAMTGFSLDSFIAYACDCGDGGGNGPGESQQGNDNNVPSCPAGTRLVEGGRDGGNYSCVANAPAPVPGCTDRSATNYNSSATTDNGSCRYPTPTCTLRAAKSPIDSGESVRLNYTTTNVTSGSISRGAGNISINRSSYKTVSPTVNTNYVLTANGPGGRVTCDVTVRVTPPPPPPPPVPSCTLTASPTSLEVSENTTLTLNSNNAVSATVDNGVGSIGLNNGKKTKKITSVGTTRFVATVRNSAGVTRTCTASVVATAPPAAVIPSCTLNANPTTISAGASSNLSWTTTNAASASISPVVGGVPVTMVTPESVSPTADTTYTMTVTSSDGNTATCAAPVKIKVEQAPTCDLNPKGQQTLTVGGDVTFSWTTTNADSVTFSDSATLSTDANNTSFPVTPGLGATTYTLTATKAGFPDAVCSTPVTATDKILPACTSFTANGKTGTLQLSAAADVTLAWTTTNATQVSIDNGVGVFTDPNSSTLVNVSSDTTFVLTPSDGTNTGAACKVVVDIDTPKTTDLSCDLFDSNLSEVRPGNDYTLSWKTTDATTVSIDQGIGVVAADDNLTLTAPNSEQTIKYVLTATNGTDTVTCPTTVRVEDSGGGGGGGSSSPRCTFRASDTKISAGEEVTLEWTTRRANEITIYEGDEDDGDEIYDTDDDDDVEEGEITVRPRKDTTYTLVAERGSRDRDCSVEIEVADDVVVLENRSQEPRVAGIALTQVPYTGFEAGPVLTFIFYALLALWGAFVAYFYILKRNPEVAAASQTQLDRDEFEKKVQRLTDIYTGRNLM